MWHGQIKYVSLETHRKRRENEEKETSEEIMTENCPKLIKEFNQHIPEDQWKLNRRNAKKTTLRHLYNQVAENES